MFCRALVFLLVATVVPLTARGQVAVQQTSTEKATQKPFSKLVFSDDFEGGLEKWTLVDPKSWKLEEHGKGRSLSITQRKSEYKPKVRSPLHIALINDM